MQYRAELVLIKQLLQPGNVVDITADNALPGKWPVVCPPQPYHLARVPTLEIGQRVVTGDAGNSGDEQGQAGGLQVGNHRRRTAWDKLSEAWSASIELSVTSSSRALSTPLEKLPVWKNYRSRTSSSPLARYNKSSQGPPHSA
jgi:hypothetical protein